MEDAINSQVLGYDNEAVRAPIVKFEVSDNRRSETTVGKGYSNACN